MEVVPGTEPENTAGSSRGGRLGLVVGGVCLGVLLIWMMIVRVLESSLLFVPTRYPKGDWDAPRRLGTPVEDLFLEAADGVRLHAWLLRGASSGGSSTRSDAVRPVILYLHGNAGNLAGRLGWVTALASTGADVLALDYRGYGRSEGSPGEEGFYEDSEALYLHATEALGVPASGVIIYGKSIGAGPACELATRRACGALILQSAFTTLPDMAAAFAPLLPSRYFLASKFDNLSKVSEVQAPKILIHSEDDDLIPFWMGEQLFEAAAEPKRFVKFKGSGHNDLVVKERDALLRVFRETISALGRP